MDLNNLSPYIRIAMYSILPEKWVLEKRVIYDYEIIYIQNGSCNINVGGKDYNCTADQVVFLRPGIPHSFRVLENGEFSQPHIHFDAVYSGNSVITPVSFKDISQMTNEEKSLISDDVFSNINIPVVFIPDSPTEFKKCFFDILNHYREKSDDTLKLKIMMLEMIRLILNQFASEKGTDQSGNSKLLYAVKEYIDANHMHMISLDDIASYFSCNKFTLLRAYREKYGETIIAYYNRKRFETASVMLVDTMLSIREISDMLNFSDEYTFSRFFKNRCGISPSSYRKEKIDN